MVLKCDISSILQYFFTFNYHRYENLNFQLKLTCLNIRDKQFIQNFSLFLNTYDSSNLYNIKSKQMIRNYEVFDGNSFQQNKFKYVVQNLQIDFLKEPILHFSKNTEKFVCNQLIKWMEIISHNKIFQFANKFKQSDFIENNLLWFSEHSFHKLENFLVNQFEKSIVRAYFQRDRLQTNYLNDIKQFYKVQKDSYKSKHIETDLIDFSFIKASQLSQTEILQKMKEMKQIEEKFLKQKDKVFQKLLQQQIQQEINQNKKKKKRRIRKRTKKLDQAQSSENKDAKKNQPQKSPKKSINMKPKNYLLEQQSVEQKDEYKTQMNFNDQISQISKIDDSQYHQTDVTIQKYFESDDKVILGVDDQLLIEEEKVQKAEKAEIQDLEIIKNAQQSKNSPMTSTGLLIDQNLEKTRTQFQSVSKQPHDSLIANESQINVQTSQGCNNKNSNLKQKKKTKKDKIVQNLTNNVIKNIRNTAFTEFIDCISIQSNNLYNYKLTCYQFIAFFISSLLPTTNISLFGSNAVGLSLASSDIDIMISNARWSNITQVRQVLYHIGNQMSKMGWVVDYKLILNAKVPVLKLFIDPKVDYFGISPLKYASETNLQQSVLIKADLIINIEGDQNIGCQSTVLMKQWLTDHPQLQRIILFFKYVLWYYGLNQNYKGGICSYCLFLMIIHCLSKRFQKQQNKGKNIFEALQDEDQGTYIIEILKYYSEVFSPKTDEISIQMGLKGSEINFQKSIKQQISPNKRNLNLKIMDPINREYIESSFSKFEQIQQLFSMILVESMKRDEQIKKIINSEQQIKEQFIKSYQAIQKLNPSFNVITKNNDLNHEAKLKKNIKKIASKIKKIQSVTYNVKDIVSIGFRLGIQNWMA